LLLVAFVMLVAGAEYFTNAVEWLGRHLRLSDSATGSLLAAIGTATPETLVSIVAIFFSSGEAAEDVGVGGILGAPFMLSTLAMLVIAMALWSFRSRRGSARLQFNADTARSDLRFFLVAYTLAVLAAFLPERLMAARWLIAVTLIPLYLIYMRRLLRTTAEESEELIGPLRILAHFPDRLLPFENWAENPGMGSVLVQVALALGLIIGGAHLFVSEVEALATTIGLEPLIFSLLITPVATELPEALNSVFWIRRQKDTLAFGNVSGALVFQSAIPVTVGIFGTEWHLSLRPGDPTFLPALSCMLALLSGTLLLIFVRRYDTLRLPHLLPSASLYLVLVAAVLLSVFAGGSAVAQ
jgi:cation:H+ antiporter